MAAHAQINARCHSHLIYVAIGDRCAAVASRARRSSPERPVFSVGEERLARETSAAAVPGGGSPSWRLCGKRKSPGGLFGRYGDR